MQQTGQKIGSAQCIHTACRDTSAMFATYKMFRWNIKQKIRLFFCGVRLLRVVGENTNNGGETFIFYHINHKNLRSIRPV